MLPTDVIRKPLITEKATAASEANRYSFAVDRRATKTDIKNAVEALYKVRVLGVSGINRKRRDRAYRYGVIAERLGMPTGSIGPTRARCLTKLLDQLRARGLGPEGDPAGSAVSG